MDRTMIANSGLNVQFAGNINIAYIYFLKTLYSVKAELIVLKPVTDNFILLGYCTLNWKIAFHVDACFQFLRGKVLSHYYKSNKADKPIG